jgi:signal transduction histidine kinase
VRLPRPSIRLRLTAWYATIFIAMGIVLLAVSYAVVRREFHNEQGKVHVAVEEIAPVKSGAPHTVRTRILPGLPPENTAPVETLSVNEREAYRRARNAYAAQVSAANDRALNNVLLAFGGALLLVTLASVAAGWIVAGRALRPISRITATARSISDRTLDARIALHGPRDELRELADTFDSMLARLEDAFESQRRFVANASHELRTPLAIVRTELDVTLDDPDANENELRSMARVIRDANERMERLIASLLALASSEAGIVQQRPTDLADVVAPALQRERLFDDGSLQLGRLGPRAYRHRARRGDPPRRQPGRAHRSRRGRGSARALPAAGVVAGALDRRLRPRVGGRSRGRAGPWRAHRRARPSGGWPRGDRLAAARPRARAAAGGRGAGSRLTLERLYSPHFYSRRF